MNNSEFPQREALPSPAHQTPECEYAQRLSERQRQLAGGRVLHRRLWTYLVSTALAGIVLAIAALSGHSISKLWILLPAVVGLSIIQSLVKNARLHEHVRQIAGFYELGVARMQHQWQGRGIGGANFRPASHPCASDLDLFGLGSVFELLCTARTLVGRAKLADWLLHPAETDELAERQLAVAELRDKLNLREDWAAAEGSTLDQAGSSVRDWADTPAFTFPFYVQVLAIALPICLIVLSLLGALGFFAHRVLWVIAVPAGLEALLVSLVLEKTRQVASNLVLPAFELALLAPLLDRLQAEHFQCRLLKELQSQLSALSGRPSKQIRELSLYGWLLHLRQIEYFALLASPLLWGTNLAICIERWRQRNREALASWLDALGRFEALLCFARYYYENPDHTFAILRPHSDSLFHAQGLGHPLLDRRNCVRCDLHFDAHGTQLVLVSGSNMSGKSTLLRAVGVNAVLALAGAPVRAERLEISRLQIGCSIGIDDSLLQAKSRFQAEVERLQWLLALSRTNNLLFLLDEMLGGTNSSDRFWGAQAVIEQLAASGAIGLVTTHDLALTEIVKVINGPRDGRALNAHFAEHYENREMKFDYRMRSGVLTRTNGWNVMAALGLLPPKEKAR